MGCILENKAIEHGDDWLPKTAHHALYDCVICQQVFL